MAEVTLLQALYTEWKMNGRLVGVTGVVYGISILWSVYVCSGRRWETWQFNPASSSLGYYLYFCSTNDILRYPDIWMICWEMSKRKENFFWILSIHSYIDVLSMGNSHLWRLGSSLSVLKDKMESRWVDIVIANQSESFSESPLQLCSVSPFPWLYS